MQKLKEFKGAEVRYLSVLQEYKNLIKNKSKPAEVEDLVFTETEVCIYVKCNVIWS